MISSHFLVFTGPEQRPNEPAMEAAQLEECEPAGALEEHGKLSCVRRDRAASNKRRRDRQKVKMQQVNVLKKENVCIQTKLETAVIQLDSMHSQVAKLDTLTALHKERNANAFRYPLHTMKSDALSIHKLPKHELSRRTAAAAVLKTLKAETPQTIDASFIVMQNIAKGSGAFGEVSVANCLLFGTNMQVAVKKATKGDLCLEAKVLKYLQGASTCIPYLFGMVNKHTLVMELIAGEGTSLRHHLQCVNLSYNEWCNISADIAAALIFIHSRGILHNDLHENNVLISSTCVVKIIDFGSATLKEEPRQYYVDPDRIDIYRKYHSHIAPELVEHQGSRQSEKTDVYALGKLLKAISCVGHIPGLISISRACRAQDVALRITATSAEKHIRKLIASW